MPQTREAIDHARAAAVPMMSRSTRSTKKRQPDTRKHRARSKWAGAGGVGRRHDLLPRLGETGEGLDDLLENILLVADLQEPAPTPTRLGLGQRDRSLQLYPGRGPVVTVLVSSRHAPGRRLAGRRSAMGSRPRDARLLAAQGRRGGRPRHAGRGPRLPTASVDAGEFVHDGGPTTVEARLPGPGARRPAPDGRQLARRNARKLTPRGGLLPAPRPGTSRSSTSSSRPTWPAPWRRSRTSSAKVPQERVAINIIHSQTGGINESDV